MCRGSKEGSRGTWGPGTWGSLNGAIQLYRLAPGGGPNIQVRASLPVVIDGFAMGTQIWVNIWK